MTLTPLLEAKQVAAFLSVCVSTVYVLAARGDLPAVKVGNRTLRFRQEDVEEFARRGMNRMRRETGQPVSFMGVK